MGLIDSGIPSSLFNINDHTMQDKENRVSSRAVTSGVDFAGSQ